MKLEFSAGGAVIKDVNGEKLILLCLQKKLSGAKVYCLPKGHIEEGETKEKAALREVKEETGVTATIKKPLSIISYAFIQKEKKIKKDVSFFLMDYVYGDFEPNNETEEIKWVSCEDALQLDPYISEREIIKEAFNVLKTL